MEMVHLDITRYENPSSEQRGEWAQLRFMAKATEQGFKLTKPWGDSSPYDFVLDLEGRFVSVQVKSTSHRKHPETQRHRSCSYGCNLRPSQNPRYQPSDFDFVALYVIPRDLWYIIPAAVVLQGNSIHVRPGTKSNPFERYREAWHLLREPPLTPAPIASRSEPISRRRNPGLVTRTKS